jgi:hypothetical protein
MMPFCLILQCAAHRVMIGLTRDWLLILSAVVQTSATKTVFRGLDRGVPSLKSNDGGSSKIVQKK